MKNKISLPAILLSAAFLSSLFFSRKFTDPFSVPKHYFFMYSGMIFLVFALIWFFNRKYKIKYTLNGIDIAVILYLLYSLVHHLISGTAVLNDIRYLNLLLSGALFFASKPFFGKNHPLNQNNKFFTTFLVVLLIIGILQSMYGFLQLTDILPNLQKEFKLGGAYGNPGPYANFLIAVLSFSFVFAVFQTKGWLKVLAITSSVAIVLILPFTQARTAWIAAMILLVYTFVHHRKVVLVWEKYFLKTRNKIILATMLAGIFTGTVFLLSGFKQESASGRLFVWKITLEMIKDKPLFGYGYSTYPVVHNDYQAEYFKANPDDYDNAFLADGINFAFNEYLQITSEIGIIGSGLFLAIFFFVFKRKKLISPSSSNDTKVLAAESAILAVLISSFFSYPLQDTSTLLLLFVSLAVISSELNVVTYTFSTTPSSRRLIAIAGIAVILISFQGLSKRIKAEKEWLRAFQLMRQKNFTEADNLYQELYPVMCYNQYFVFNYGAELTVMGNYVKSAEVLKEVEPRINDSDYYIYLGSSLEGIGKNKEALECFEHASNIMPVKFYPIYRLALLHNKIGNTDQALFYAKKIMGMPVKIESDIVTNIKKEMELFTKEHSPIE